MWSFTSPIDCMNAYTVVGPTNFQPRRFRSLASAFDSSVVVNADSSARVKARPRDGGAIRPVAPFLEVFARTSDDTLEPLTLALLDKHKLTPALLKWRVDVGNLKIFRRTGTAADRIEASAEFSDHKATPLEGHCANFFDGKVLPYAVVDPYSK